MKGRKLIQVLADRAVKPISDARRRKVSDYAAIVVGFVIIAAMSGSPTEPDEATLGALVVPTDSSVEVTKVEKTELVVANPTVVGYSAPPERLVPAAEPVDVADDSLDVAEEIAIVLQPKPTVAPAPTPTPEPSRPVASSRSSRPVSTPAERFIADHAAAAQESMHNTSVPASVTLAQGILESNSGQSLLATKANNYFGIKARGKEGPAGVVYMDTWEHLGGKDVTKREPFRAYNNAAESFTDHGEYLRDNARYAAAFKHAADAREFARQIHKAGYATDPNYASKLIKLMDRYDLYEFDR